MIWTYDHILPQLFTQVDNLLTGFVHEAYQHLSQLIYWPLMICLQLCIIVTGYAVMQGWMQPQWGILSHGLCKTVVIVLLVTHWDVFNASLLHFFFDGMNDLCQHLTNAFSGSTLAASHSLPEITQDNITQVIRLGVGLWHESSLTHLSMFLAGILILLFGLMACLTGALQLLISKILLSALLALTPIFCTLALFQQCLPLTLSWFGCCISLSLYSILIGIMMCLNHYLLSQVLPDITQAQLMHFKLVDIFPIIIVSSLVTIAMLRLRGIAHQIGQSFGDHKHWRQE